MTESTTGSQIFKSINRDYTNNFMPRKEIKYRLSDLRELTLILEDKQFRESLTMVWGFKFYVHLMISDSVQKIMKDSGENNYRLKPQSIKSWLYDHYVHHEMFGTNQTRAILFELLCIHAPEKLSILQLRDAYTGHSIHNDHCAWLAWKIRQEREHKEGKNPQHS